MTVAQAIAFADDTKPNAFSEKTKTRWLSDCEGMVQTDIMLLAPEEITGYSWEEDRETQLLAAPPFDKLYISYLCAMIDFANGEYNKYGNTYAMFNGEFGAFSRWFCDAYRPADRRWEGEEVYD